MVVVQILSKLLNMLSSQKLLYVDFCALNQTCWKLSYAVVSCSFVPFPPSCSIRSFFWWGSYLSCLPHFSCQPAIATLSLAFQHSCSIYTPAVCRVYCEPLLLYFLVYHWHHVGKQRDACLFWTLHSSSNLICERVLICFLEIEQHVSFIQRVLKWKMCQSSVRWLPSLVHHSQTEYSILNTGWPSRSRTWIGLTYIWDVPHPAMAVGS